MLRLAQSLKIIKYGKRFLPYVEDALASLENGRLTLQNNDSEKKENIRTTPSSFSSSDMAWLSEG
jgi:DNA-binding transcriptional LysR family regulator